LLPVPEKQFQPNFNFCCGGRKKKKSRESERLDGIDNNPHETEQTNDAMVVTSNHEGNMSDADNRHLSSNGEIHEGEKTHVVTTV
jgi:hypothetical protein